MRKVADQGFEYFKGIGASGDFVFENDFGFVPAACQGKHCANLHSPFLTNALDLLQVGNADLPEFAKAVSAAGKQVTGNLKRVFT